MQINVYCIESYNKVIIKRDGQMSLKTAINILLQRKELNVIYQQKRGFS